MDLHFESSDHSHIVIAESTINLEDKVFTKISTICL